MCVTVVGRVTEVAGERAVVLVGERPYTVDASLYPQVQPGACVVIQAGLIMDTISEEEASALEAVQRELAEMFAATSDT